MQLLIEKVELSLTPLEPSLPPLGQPHRIADGRCRRRVRLALRRQKLPVIFSERQATAGQLLACRIVYFHRLPNRVKIGPGPGKEFDLPGAVQWEIFMYRKPADGDSRTERGGFASDLEIADGLAAALRKLAWPEQT